MQRGPVATGSSGESRSAGSVAAAGRPGCVEDEAAEGVVGAVHTFELTSEVLLPRPPGEGRRVDRMERILPTLATKEDLKATEVRMRTHFDVVTESLRHDIQLVAEAVATLSEREQ